MISLLHTDQLVNHRKILGISASVAGPDFRARQLPGFRAIPVFDPQVGHVPKVRFTSPSSPMYKIANQKYQQYKTKLESTRENDQRAPAKPMANLIGNLFSGLMKKINAPQPVIVEEQTVTQNTTFTNLSLTASSNQVTDFNSDSLSPGENPKQMERAVVSQFIKPATRPKVFHRKMRKPPVPVPKKMAPPMMSREQVEAPEQPSKDVALNSKQAPIEFGSSLVKPPTKKLMKRKNKFKGNRFVAFDINKL